MQIARSAVGRESERVKVLVVGASGMVGQGVLRECLAAPDVSAVLALVRAPTPAPPPKLRELVCADFTALTPLEAELSGVAACFYCAGVSSFRMTESAYAHVTYDLTLAVARTLVRLNPGSTFVYVSGAGTDSSERGPSMWARVKGRTENALLALPWQAYMFRPAVIRPVDGIVSKTPVYRLLYAALAPILPVVQRLLPNQVTSTRQVGRAMLAVARHGTTQRILETRDINAL